MDETRAEESSSHRQLIDVLAEEFAEKLRKGESPSIEAYANQFPELAEEIRDLFPTLMIINRASPQEESQGREVSTWAGHRSQIGDYRIVRKIGQGGMGVVYEAQQESLGRRVALKVLPFNISKDTKFVERFKREARAAAKLHHTNIVPVFEVGQDGETLYYAMQFIEGQALDEVQKEIIRLEREDPASHHSSISKLISGSGTSANSSGQRQQGYFKSIARIGASVADALGYAHDRAIVHRDVKPSNLILDTEGVVWLTDFGLAKTTDSELTETGDFLGTARYMSPERFKGPGDHRGDIYGLGITLYEMLTLRRAFGADDRLQLVEQIANAEPRRPRDINRSIPLDLETIILKAMDKDPRRRYQSAQEVSDDLRRFVNDQPIRARRASLLERTVRWSRRNKALSAAMVSMAVAIVVLIASSILILQQRDIAQANLIEANKQKTRADAAADVAKREAQTAREVVQRMLTAVGDIRLRNVPQMDGLRLELLEDALEFNQQFLARTNEQSDKREAAHAHGRIAEIHSLMEKHEQTRASFRNAREIFASLVAENPDDTDSRFMLGEIDQELARLHIERRELPAARPLVERSIAEYEALKQLEPNDPLILLNTAVGYQLHALVNQRTGNNAAAESDLARALDSLMQIDEATRAEARYQFEIARTRLLHARLLFTTRRPNPAKEEMDQAITIYTALMETHPDEREYREAYASSLTQIGTLQLNMGQPLDAQSTFRIASDTFLKLVNDFPQIPDYQSNAATCLNGLAVSLAIAGETNLAEIEFRRSAEICEELLADFPNVTAFRNETAQTIRMLAVHFLNTDRPEEALEPFARAYEIMEQLSQEYPAEIGYRIDLAELAFLMGSTIRGTDAGNAEGAAWTTKAIDIAEELVKEIPEQTRVRHKLAKYQRLLANYERDAEQYEQAAQRLDRALELHRQLLVEVPEYEEHHRHLAITLHDYAELLIAQQRFADAEVHAREALSIRQSNVAKFPNRFDHAIEMLISRVQLGEILTEQQTFDAAVEQFRNAVEFCKQMIEQHPEMARFRYQHLVALQKLARLLVNQDQMQQAQPWIDRAREFAQAETEREDPDPATMKVAQEILENWGGE